jgi:hypothetical protein
MEHSEAPESDSLMEYITTTNLSLVIYPDKRGNLAKFISGVNDRKKHKANLNSMKCKIDNNVHIILYSKQKIEKDQILYYDYNAGGLNEYDVSQFI